MHEQEVGEPATDLTLDRFALKDDLQETLVDEELGAADRMDRQGSFFCNVDSLDSPTRMRGDTCATEHQMNGPNLAPARKRRGSEMFMNGNGFEFEQEGLETLERALQGHVGLEDLASQLFSEFCNGSQDGQLADEQVRSFVNGLERLVDWHYDTMLAELILARLETQFPRAEQRKVLTQAVVRRLDRKLRYIKIVGQACCSQGASWFNVYKDGDLQSIDGCIDPRDSTILHYKARVTIPAGLTTVMCVANEIEMLPMWNKLVVGVPEVVGRRTAHYMCLNYQMSFLGGMYKIDILNEVRRFSDTKGGLLVEYIRSVSDAHPCHRPVGSGFKRPQTELKNVWLACGENSSVLIQVGKLKLPFSSSRWLASSLGGVAGRFIVSGLINNSLRAAEPGNPWEDKLKADKLGFYARLQEVMESDGSRRRAPATSGGAPLLKEAELAPLFNKGPYAKDDSVPDATFKDNISDIETGHSAADMNSYAQDQDLSGIDDAPAAEGSA